MRILFVTCTPAAYMAPPSLGDEQINCGPDWPDQDIGGYVLSLKTPLGQFDLAAVAARLPSDQQPDAVVCLVDASWRSVPRNLGTFKCPKILLVADTHHLNNPITGMVSYALSEPYDRTVLLYDRHHWEFFHAGGVRNLHWFPGLTFPHTDEAVRAARSCETPANQIAFVGQTGICHPRRLQVLTQLNAHGLPLVVKSLPQREALGFYNASLIGFNASLNGDLNLRVFEILASGALLLTDALTPVSGLGDILENGREYLSYGSPSELIAHARQALANPPEAQVISKAGAKRFDALFSAAARRQAFQALVINGVSRPEFALPSTRTFSDSPIESPRLGRLMAGFEYVQELHRNLDTLVVAMDPSVPAEFGQMCASLPRLEVRHGLPEKGVRVDFLAVGKESYASSNLIAATHVWPWEISAEDKVALTRRCTSMGLSLVNAELQIFSRQRVNTHSNDGAVALVRLEQGGYDDALLLAQKELGKNPKSVDAHLVLLELSQEKGNEALAQAMWAKLKVIAPHHPRLADIIAAKADAIRLRRPKRLLGVARARLAQKQWVEADKVIREALAINPSADEAYFLLGCIAAQGEEVEQALNMFGRASELAPTKVEYWRARGRLLRQIDRLADALGSLLMAATLEPSSFEDQLALGDVAIAAGHGAIAMEALEAAVQMRPEHTMARVWLERARVLQNGTDYTTPRDLLLSHVEVTRLQGTGVLIERFFPDSSHFITVRSRTLYKGGLNFGGLHYSLDLPGLDENFRRGLLQRLLAPYQIRRILCVPFFASDFMHGVAARELTGAPLCTYVMDDQVLHAREVPQELARRLFASSDLRLAISPEMIGEYSAWFRCSFGLLPPIVTKRDHECPNEWTAARGPVSHCAMVGNIWSAKQFEQLRTFTRSAGLKVDWFGNSKVAWLSQNKGALEADGIFCQGFLPEPELANRLSGYPFVVLPSGMLDGTEDNEWLTRLSLPSRMVFILTKTFTPMLVLGSPKTAAARFVQQFGLGTSSNYEASEARAKIDEITLPGRRIEILANARRLAPSFLMPDCGEWIWRSLAGKASEPTPFDQLYRAPSATPVIEQVAVTTSAGDAGIAIVPDVTFSQQIDAIVPKLTDWALHDSYLPPQEPRQRADVRGAVLFLHDALSVFAELKVKLLAVQRLSLLVKNHRGVLVTWAELLERDGDKTEAAAKARQALSLYYDDVHTQTLFVRCVGDVNFHAEAKDRFCPHPFENFEIYKDGSVFPCNCTQVPFPIGNAHTQTKEEIWQSPQARAIRTSILDGSFRYCSPMTCWQRFNLPKKSEQPERFAQLEKIGVEGAQMPKHLNLSYDLSCNLSCPSCRNGTIMATADERSKLDRVRDNIVLPLLAEKAAETVYITGSGDAFGSPHFRGILKEICDPKYGHVQITLGTNGQLITPRLWEEFTPLHSRFQDITISIDGANPDTYERLRRGSTWEKLLRTMGVLSTARRAGLIRRVMVNMVVQQQNFLEMRPMIELCKGWAVDGIRFYRIRQWGNVIPGDFMSSDVANPLHRRHHELLAELAHPLFTDPIVDHYDMYALILLAQAATPANTPVAELISA